MVRTRSQEAAIRNSSPEALAKVSRKSPDRVLKASQRRARSTSAKASGNRKLSKTERSSIKPETVTTEIESIRAGLQAEKQERVQAADQNETQKDKDTCDAILVTKSRIPGHGATLEHARMALSEALEKGILKFNRRDIVLKDELEKLVYIQMMVRRRFLSTYKRKKLSRFEKFDRHAIQKANQIVHSGDARLDATLFRDFGGERTDTDVFKKMYGLTPAQVLRVEHQPTIEAINRHASQIASKYTDHYNSQIEASFHKFIKSFADSGFD